MSDQPATPATFTKEYATDVRLRFEKLEADLKHLTEFAKRLGLTPRP